MAPIGAILGVLVLIGFFLYGSLQVYREERQKRIDRPDLYAKREMSRSK